MLKSDIIKNAARRAGFDICGIAESRNLDAESAFFDRWLGEGNEGGLEYLRRNAAKRFSPELLWEGARSVIVCGVGYRNGVSAGYPEGWGDPKVSSYALSADYHDTVKAMLHGLAAELTALCGDFRYRAFCDTAPLAEKSWAIRAGLGWQGRNSLLINPELGSFLLLGEIVTDAEVDVYDTPYEGPGCAGCERCVNRCPNSAILSGNCIDARRCISRLTVEKCEDVSLAPGGDTLRRDQPSAPALHGWIYGCDECQSVCPYNIAAPLYRNQAFRPVFDPLTADREYWLSMTPEEFKALFGKTPLYRTGLRQIKRNVK